MRITTPKPHSKTDEIDNRIKEASTHHAVDPDAAKEDLKLLADYIVNRTSCLAVTKFLLGLAFKLWILDLDADDRGQALTDIFTA